MMATAGPGEYVSPPAIAGSSIVFVDMTYSNVVQPGGVAQLFRFRGVRTGPTTLQFHHTPLVAVFPDVIDTVIVR